MSIATTKQKTCLHQFQNPNKEPNVSTITRETSVEERLLQQWNSKKSIDTIIENCEIHVTKPKQLARQTPVVALEAETEEKPEIEEEKLKEEEEEDIVVTTLKDIYDGDDENYIDQEDYQIYQDGKVSDFFKDDIPEKPTKVADICLVNDHYILVKMTDCEHDNAESKDLEALRDANAKPPKDSSHRDNRKFCGYIKNKRNRITRIAPIHEEPEDLINSDEDIIKRQSKLLCLKGYSCWRVKDEEVEVYQTQTKIKKSPLKSTCITTTNLQTSSTITKDAKNDPEAIQQPKELPTISGSLIKSSLQRQVALRNYGSLVSQENNNNNNINIIDFHKTHPLPSVSAPPRRKCPRFESFYWLLRPFRGKYRKPKPKIQAVVYKTYFVKWTKPPDTLTHGYGVKSSELSDTGTSVLRRCRSAVF